MVLSLFFFAASYVVGAAVLELSKIYLHSLLKFAIATTIGLVINVLLIFFAAFQFNLNLPTILIVAAATSLPSFLYLLKKSSLLPDIETNNLRTSWKEILVLGILVLVIINLFIKSIFLENSSIIAGNRIVWTDWPVHFAFLSSFAFANNFPPQNPLYSGPIATYPFMSDFTSAILKTLGADYKIALILPGILLTFLSIILLYYFGILITNSKRITVTGILIGFFWGGIGFVYFFQDLAGAQNILEFLKYPPHEYTFYAEKNLWFFNFLYSEILPQRAFLFGLPLFFTSLILQVRGLYQNKKNLLAISGYLVAIMPFFHMHSFISFLILDIAFFILFVVNRARSDGLHVAKKSVTSTITYHFMPIVAVGLIQLPLFLSLNRTQTMNINLGWMKESENFFWFWFKNTGFFLPLLAAAAFLFRKNQFLFAIILSSFFLFILPNIFRFAPWPYDNLKIFTYWYLISAFPAALTLAYIFKRGHAAKFIAVILFISLTLSGTIEIARLSNTEKSKIKLWSKEDLALADTIIEKTEPDAKILTAAIHDHPVSALAGRKLIIGFPGNAWSWGFSDWSQRETDVRTIFKAESTVVSQLLKKYNVDYILISSREKFFEPEINEVYFSQNYTLVAAGQDYKLFKAE